MTQKYHKAEFSPQDVSTGSARQKNNDVWPLITRYNERNNGRMNLPLEMRKYEERETDRQGDREILTDRPIEMECQKEMKTIRKQGPNGDLLVINGDDSRR